MKATQRKRGGGNKRKAAQSLDPAEAARLQAAIERTGTLSNAEVAQASQIHSRYPTRTIPHCNIILRIISQPSSVPPPPPSGSAHACKLCCASQQVLKADTLPCALHDKTCKGKAENPNCLCGLVPAPESSRRQGLWQRDVAAMLKLGPDPSTSKREVRCFGMEHTHPRTAIEEYLLCGVAHYRRKETCAALMPTSGTAQFRYTLGAPACSQFSA